MTNIIQEQSMKLSTNQEKSFLQRVFENEKLILGIVFCFALLLYLNTLGHGFVLDDYMVIKKNTFTQKGFSGWWDILTKDSFFGYFNAMNEDPKALLVTGGRYRPLSLLLFASIYQFFGENAMIFHLITIFLYAMTGLILYKTIGLMLLEKYGTASSKIIAALASILFIAHPIHTEVTANIKGCDEILALMGSLIALYASLKAWDSGLKKWYYVASISFFMACLSKENSVTFLAIIPATLWFFRSQKNSSFAYSKLLLGLGSAFITFFIMRGNALNWEFSNQAPTELMNNPFIKWNVDHFVPFTGGERLATIMVTLGKYIFLLIFPHPLTHDYYPHQIGMTTLSSPIALASILLYLGLVGYTFYHFKKKEIVVYGILFYLITLSIVSNLFVPVGTLMNERFLFMPSIGFVLMVAAIMYKYLSQKPVALFSILVALLGMYSFKTVSRNSDWVSNEKLFLEDVKISTNSGKAHDDAGGVLFNAANKQSDTEKKNQLLQEAIGHFDKAIEIHPKLRHAIMHRAASYNLTQDYEKSIAEYKKALSYWPNDQKIKEALALSLQDYGKDLGKKNQSDQARIYLNEALKYHEIDKTMWLMAVSFAKEGRFEEANSWFLKALAKDPENAGYLYDIGTTYHRLGDHNKGEEYYQKAIAINPDIVKSREKK